MADNAPKQDPQNPPLETIFNSSIDDDWGEAFEAEDFLASPKGDASDSSEFFLPESPTIGPGTVGIPPHDAGAPTKSIGPSDQIPAPRIGFPTLARIKGLSLPLKIALAATPVALGVALFLFTHTPTAPPTSATKTEPQPKPTVAVQHAEPPDAQPSPHQAEPPAAITAPPAKEEPQHAAAKPEENEIRKKWRFPAVIVQAKTDKGQETTILSTDLTLVLKLPLEAMPPSAKDAFVREMIYQFYANQPLEDLRRFALERGEMTRKLQSWIAKQWPGLPLDSVAIDRYQLL